MQNTANSLSSSYGCDTFTSIEWTKKCLEFSCFTFWNLYHRYTRSIWFAVPGLSNLRKLLKVKIVLDAKHYYDIKPFLSLNPRCVTPASPHHQRWEFIKKTNKKVRKKEYTLSIQKATKKTYQETKKVFSLKNINQFYFLPLILDSVYCQFDQIESKKMRLNIQF